MTWLHGIERAPHPQTREFLEGVLQATRPRGRIILNASYGIHWTRPMLTGDTYPECDRSNPGSSGVMFEEQLAFFTDFMDIQEQMGFLTHSLAGLTLSHDMPSPESPSYSEPRVQFQSFTEVYNSFPHRSTLIPQLFISHLLCSRTEVVTIRTLYHRHQQVSDFFTSLKLQPQLSKA